MSEVVDSIKIKEVQLRRREERSHLPPQVVADSKKNLGSHFVGQQPLRGLTREEEKKYLPGLLGVSPDSPDWEKEIKNYWASLTVPIPVGGLVLNITLDEEGNPLNLTDWITYKWAQKHKLVADSEQEMRSNPIKKFYIYDPERADKRQNQEVHNRKKAYRELIKLTHPKAKDDAKVDRVFRLLTGVNPDRLTEEQKENRMETIASDDPERFYQVVTDKDLDIRAEISEMLEYEVLRKLGNHILFNDDVIGDTMEEAVLFFKNGKNADTVILLRSQLKEKRESTPRVAV